MFAKLVLIGNVGQDPEYTYNDTTGETYMNFSVAVTTGKDEKKRTDWYKCTVKADSQVAKYCSDYVRSGDKVYIEGLPKVNSYMNKERQLIANINIWVNQINIVASKKIADPNDGSTVEPPVAENWQDPDSHLASLPVA